MSSRYREVFFKSHTLLVAIHATSAEQVLSNVGIAKRAGADGVFLVNHHHPHYLLTEWFEAARREYRNYWIGLNYLDLSQQEAIQAVPPTASGLWVDDMGVRDDEQKTPNSMNSLRAEWWNLHPGKLHFGGVAFKGQQSVASPADAARNAIGKTDVITTSGVKTGSAPEVQKMAAMRQAIGKWPLALASGTTAENVHLFKPYVDCFIVASSISKSFDELDLSKTYELAQEIHRR